MSNIKKLVLSGIIGLILTLLSLFYVTGGKIEPWQSLYGCSTDPRIRGFPMTFTGRPTGAVHIECGRVYEPGFNLSGFLIDLIFWWLISISIILVITKLGKKNA